MRSAVSRVVPLLFFLVLMTGVLSAHPQPVTLQGELWIRRDRMDPLQPAHDPREFRQMTDRENVAFTQLLDDARWVFSGMIYGFTFSWTPSSRARQVEEVLVLEPVALIPWGDPRMEMASMMEREGFLYAKVVYHLDPDQQVRRSAWEQEHFPRAAGRGELPLVAGGLRRDTLKEAIKETVRAWLRARDYNKPQNVRGRVALIDFPDMGMTAGKSWARVRIRMVLEPIRHYSAD